MITVLKRLGNPRDVVADVVEIICSNVMITQKSHQNLANIFKISISQEIRNTYFKGAFCWLKILISVIRSRIMELEMR